MSVAFLSATAWPDADGRHFWLRHECVNGWDESMLPNIWHEKNGKLNPSVHCVACGLHSFVAVEVRDAMPDGDS